MGLLQKRGGKRRGVAVGSVLAGNRVKYCCML